MLYIVSKKTYIIQSITISFIYLLGALLNLTSNYLKNHFLFFENILLYIVYITFEKFLKIHFSYLTLSLSLMCGQNRIIFNNQNLRCAFVDNALLSIIDTQTLDIKYLLHK